MVEVAGRVEGFCNEKFGSVRAEFEKNFAQRGELGAAVAIYVDGEAVVDLWGGVTEQGSNAPWKRDTLVEVFSATKGLSAACMHVLIDRGLLDPDAPVAKYWPEFAANGKGTVTVAMALSHQTGLPLWQAPLPKGGLFDWNLGTSLLAAEAPIWKPGTGHGYHAVTSGFLWGEILRRITGKTIGTFLRDEIAGPLGADVWIGLPESEEKRVARMVMPEFDPNSPFFAKALNEPDWIGAKMLNNVGDLFAPDVIDSRPFREYEGPSTSGVVTAAGLARFYAPLSLDGSIDGVRIVRAEQIPAMHLIRSASSCDLMLQMPTAFALGFSKTWGVKKNGPGNYAILGEHAFGTPGMGGSIGFADADARLSFAYVMNRVGPGVALNERGQSLIDATYRTLGFASDAPGVWVR